MTTLSAKLQAVRARIARAARQCGRAPDTDVQLLAVSKTWPALQVRRAGSRRPAGFWRKLCAGRHRKSANCARWGLNWHFIGSLQANKTRLVAEAFDWVHSLDRLRIAQRLSEQRPASLPPLSVCLQVNVSGEAAKGGVSPAALRDLAQEVAHLPQLRLRGLMTLPAAERRLQRAAARLPLLAGTFRTTAGRWLVARYTFDGHVA
jgi:pyridoxal phosphate enzyme (YggS family)